MGDPEDLPQYSVMQTVYAGDEPSELDAGIRSVLTQSHPPSELLIVADGPLTDELSAIIDRHRAASPSVVTLLELSENRGRGAAARAGIDNCTFEFVGIMSADDICVPTRFERQLSVLTANPAIDVVGGHVAEFVDDPDDPQTVRRVPTDPAAIERMAKFRSPMNEVTVTFRRDAVLAAGNYRPVGRMEDYDLWVRLLQDGATLANLDAVLVKMRAGEDLFARRGGIEYASEELRQQKALLEMGFIGVPRFLCNVAMRVPIRLVPNRIRSLIYRRLLRDGSAESH